MSHPDDQSPINPLPPVVVALALLIFATELMMQAGARGFVGGPDAVGWRIEAIRTYAFSGPILDWMIETRRAPPEHLMRFVTYPFVHINFTHAVMVLVFLLALGKMVGEVFGTLAVLVVFFLSSIVGALAYGLLLNDPAPLVGGYPAVYGLIGSYTFMLWASLTGTGNTQLRAFTLIGFLMGIQLLFGLVFGSNKDWLADIFGFATGFFVSFLMVPGVWGRIRDRLRNR
ncbi:MAG: rhomboid family intramembrane serine protease, partial [Paracoccaceae bacterium]